MATGSATAGRGVSPPDDARARELRARLPVMCAAIRASLARHLANEEEELWPLFADYFTEEEQVGFS